MIQKSLPRIKREIKDKKRKAQDHLDRIGSNFPESDDKKMELIFKMVRQFKENFHQGISGKYIHNQLSQSAKKSSQNDETTMYKLSVHFAELYEDYTQKDFKITSEYTDQYISQAIANYQNQTIPGFQSFDSFLYLITPILARLTDPVIHLLEDCKNILEEEGCEIIDRIFKKFPMVHQEVKDCFGKELSRKRNEVKALLEGLLKCEDNYLFTNDPLFLQNKIGKEKFDNTQDLLVIELRSKIDAYFLIVVRNLRD